MMKLKEQSPSVELTCREEPAGRQAESNEAAHSQDLLRQVQENMDSSSLAPGAAALATGGGGSAPAAAAMAPPAVSPWQNLFTGADCARFQELLRRLAGGIRLELKNQAVPLTLLGALLVFPRLLLIFVPAVLLWWGVESVYRRLGPTSRLRIRRLVPERWINSRIFRELSDGMAQVRPFILGALYLSFIPFALLWMYAHWLLRLNKPAEKEDLEPASDTNISLKQNCRPVEEEEEANFFHSPAFAVTSALLFVSGLPAAATYLLYQKLGIDAIMGFPSLEPGFNTVFVIICLYIYSVGWCMSTLFFRSWFTFPLNFLGSEEELELSERGIRRFSRSWFTQVITWNAPWAGPPSLDWTEIKALRLDCSNSSLYPLPQTAFAANSLVYTILNRLALFVDGLNRNGRREEYAYFTTAESVLATSERIACGSSIRLSLSQLNGDERARLYYAVRKWAPHVVVDEALQEQIMGTTVLQAPCYTQLWFDLLADKMQTRHAGVLPPGTRLVQGNLTIIERLASGGQANIYLSRQDDGSEVVLKEFILSTSNAVGALVESAGEFETETTLLSELDHPRIVKMHRCFAEDRRLYIVLEKIDGMSLRRLLREKKNPFTEKETIDAALAVCDVLEYLHGQQPPVVHRDISPDNLIFSQDHGVKVIDFSLAAARKVRRTTSTMGKHSYAPPEQFREQPCPQSDIYALGATMYFLLTGQDPKPITCSDVSARRSDITEPLRDIIKRATAFDLENRYAAVEWLKLDLEAALAAVAAENGGVEPLSEPPAGDSEVRLDPEAQV